MRNNNCLFIILLIFVLFVFQSVALSVVGVTKTHDAAGIIVIKLSDGNEAYVCGTASTARSQELMCQEAIDGEAASVQYLSPPNSSIPILGTLSCFNADNIRSCIPSYTSTCTQIVDFSCIVEERAGKGWHGSTFYIAIIGGVVALTFVIIVPCRLMRRRAWRRQHRRQQATALAMQNQPLQVPSISNQVSSTANYPRQQTNPPGFGFTTDTQAAPNVDPLVARGFSPMAPPSYDSIVKK